MKLKPVIKITSFFLLVAILLLACKKAETVEGDFAKIDFSDPLNGTQYKVFDTVTVKAFINHDRILQTVTLKLVNESFVPVASTVIINPNEFSYYLTVFFPLDNIHLYTGNYYFVIEASDGENTAVSYKPIKIVSEPLKRNGFILFTKPASQKVNIVKVDSLNAQQNIMSNLTCDFAGAAVSSHSQIVYVAGKYIGDFNAIDIKTSSVKWNLPIVSSSSPYFTGVNTSGDNVFVSFFNGIVKRYDKNGAYKFPLQSSVSGYYPGLVYDEGDYYLTEQIDFTSSAKKIAMYRTSNGSLVQELNTNINILNFYKRNFTEYFVFGNDNSGQGIMTIYQSYGNSIWSPHTLPSGKLISATQIDTAKYVIAHENGNIYHYDYSINSLVSIGNGINANKIIYDQIKNQLAVVESNSIKLYNLSFSLTSPVQTIASTDSIYDAQVWYNK